MFKEGDTVKLNTLTHKYKDWQNVLHMKNVTLDTEFKIYSVGTFTFKGDHKEDTVCIKALYEGWLPSSMFYLATKEIVYEIC